MPIQSAIIIDTASIPGQTDIIEQRVSRRYPFDWPVLLEYTSRTGKHLNNAGVLRDISASGAYVHTKDLPGIGAKLKVRIKMPIGTEVWMSFNAQVVRVEGAAPRAGIAMRFLNKRPAFTTV